jgi:hypothetical protein
MQSYCYSYVHILGSEFHGNGLGQNLRRMQLHRTIEPIVVVLGQGKEEQMD